MIDSCAPSCPPPQKKWVRASPIAKDDFGGQRTAALGLLHAELHNNTCRGTQHNTYSIFFSDRIRIFLHIDYIIL